MKNYKNESSNIGFMKKILICLIYVWVSAVCTAHVQVGFARNKLYNIVPVNYSGKAVGYDPDSKRVVLINCSNGVSLIYLVVSVL